MNDQRPVRVLIADDHTLVRAGIKAILDAQERYEVVGEAGDADEALQLAGELKPDLLLLDLGFPSKSGIEVLYEIRERGLAVVTAVLTMHESEQMLRQSIAAGAKAYILKDFTPENLLDTLGRCLRGEVVVPDKLQDCLADISLSEQTLRSKEATDGDPLSRLSKREREVFFLLADGMPNRTIAKKLFISPRTVETHRARVIKKLGFKSTADLIRYAIKNNLLSP